jgi:hypothetical protein
MKGFKKTGLTAVRYLSQKRNYFRASCQPGVFTASCQIIGQNRDFKNISSYTQKAKC